MPALAEAWWKAEQILTPAREEQCNKYDLSAVAMFLIGLS
jgi:hypothetical protein